MAEAVVALLLSLVPAQQAPVARQEPANLVFEGTAEPHYARTDDHIQLNAGLALQGWRNGEVRIRLPRPGSKSQNLVKGHGARLTVESPGIGTFGDGESWKQLRCASSEGN